jgi:hypothetical protein
MIAGVDKLHTAGSSIVAMNRGDAAIPNFDGGGFNASGQNDVA